MKRNEIFTTIAVENTVKTMSPEPLDALAMSLLPQIQEFFDSETGKKMYAEYLMSKREGYAKAA